ncbi:MAG: ComEA family DNA-binding protein [Actinophytocola sp.]|nr:ComEA family DNA-binding protein [Actinophytocola sp.]
MSPAVAAGSSATEPAELVVSVVGKVAKPGLVRVEAGARVADVLEAAGGAKPGVDLTSLNLARTVADGEQVHVGVPVPPGSAAGDAAAGSEPAKVDLNAATSEQLQALPGVGEVTARRILDWRAQHGAFTAVEQLREIQGIGERRLAGLREYVVVPARG